MKICDMTNEELLEDFRLFAIACEENPENIGHDSWLYDLRQELLSRMIPDELRITD